MMLQALNNVIDQKDNFIIMLWDQLISMYNVPCSHYIGVFTGLEM